MSKALIHVVVETTDSTGTTVRREAIKVVQTGNPRYDRSIIDDGLSAAVDEVARLLPEDRRPEGSAHELRFP